MSILKIKDSQGNWISIPTIKGDKGNTGNGISSTILNDDYTLTFTFTDGTTYKTPSIRGDKGDPGEPGINMEIHICSITEYDSQTRVPTIVNPDSSTFYLVPSQDGTSPDLFTEWVYVNNAWEMFGSASVDLTDYVKNTDIASTTKAGVVKINNGYGIITSPNGELFINTALEIDAKNGNNIAKPVTPYSQHASTFYGLAKAAGHDEKNSTLSIGQYTDEAKSSIQTMLGVPSTDDIINDIKINNSSIVSNGIATIPIGNSETYGVFKTNSANGIFNDNGTLAINNASESDIKGGTEELKPLTPNREHMAVFYGLAKASGDTTQLQSNNAIGTYTNEAKANIQTMLGVPSEDDVVNDVQLNGTSIVSNGTANIPMATSSTLGICFANQNRGIGIRTLSETDAGQLYIDRAYNYNIRLAADEYRPIVPFTQHVSVFYGLAKLSGDTTQASSSNAIGTYTDEAKDKIQTMLGVSPLIALHELDPFESAHAIGELFIANGKLYRAKTALAVGEYINEGTNVEVVNVAEVLDSKVKDVQVNGTSIISDGVANIPYAAYNKIGVVQVNASRGTAMSGSTISTFPVDSATAKAGVQAYQPITPAHQHESVFYGLAKAAGDTTQASSENAVGTYTDNAKTSIQTMLGLNGVIKNTDYANSTTGGIVKVNTDWGIGIYDPAWSGGSYGNFLYISPPDPAQVKAGSTLYKAVTPGLQHQATFYGLAKAAGVDMASSSNAVGTYTDAAKTAIKNMLGVHDNFDSFAQTITGTDVTIVGQSSYRYNCGQVYSLDITPPSTGIIDVRFTSGSTPTVLTLPSTVKMPDWWAGIEANTIYEMCITDGVYCGVMTWAL